MVINEQGKNEEVEKVLKSFLLVTADLRASMEAATCIEQTRLLLDCLKVFGINGEAVSVRLVVHYEGAKVAYVSGLSAEEEKKCQEYTNYGQLPTMDKGKGYQGHVVALIERAVLVDLTIRQADIPSAGLRIEEEEVALFLDKPIPEGDQFEVRIEGTTADDQAVKISWSSKEDTSFMETGAWEPSYRVVGIVAREMFQSLVGQKASLTGVYSKTSKGK